MKMYAVRVRMNGNIYDCLLFVNDIEGTRYAYFYLVTNHIELYPLIKGEVRTNVRKPSVFGLIEELIKDTDWRQSTVLFNNLYNATEISFSPGVDTSDTHIRYFKPMKLVDYTAPLAESFVVDGLQAVRVAIDRTVLNEYDGVPYPGHPMSHFFILSYNGKYYGFSDNEVLKLSTDDEDNGHQDIWTFENKFYRKAERSLFNLLKEMSMSRTSAMTHYRDEDIMAKVTMSISERCYVVDVELNTLFRIRRMKDVPFTEADYLDIAYTLVTNMRKHAQIDTVFTVVELN